MEYEDIRNEPTIIKRTEKVKNYYAYKVLFIAVVILAMLGLAYYEFNREMNLSYQSGTRDGALQLAYAQTSSGNIYYLSNATGNISLEYENIKTICEGLK